MRRFLVLLAAVALPLAASRSLAQSGSAGEPLALMPLDDKANNASWKLAPDGSFAYANKQNSVMLVAPGVGSLTLPRNVDAPGSLYASSSILHLLVSPCLEKGIVYVQPEEGDGTTPPPFWVITGSFEDAIRTGDPSKLDATKLKMRKGWTSASVTSGFMPDGRILAEWVAPRMAQRSREGIVTIDDDGTMRVLREWSVTDIRGFSWALLTPEGFVGLWQDELETGELDRSYAAYIGDDERVVVLPRAKEHEDDDDVIYSAMSLARDDEGRLVAIGSRSMPAQGLDAERPADAPDDWSKFDEVHIPVQILRWVDGDGPELLEPQDAETLGFLPDDRSSMRFYGVSHDGTLAYGIWGAPLTMRGLQRVLPAMREGEFTDAWDRDHGSFVWSPSRGFERPRAFLERNGYDVPDDARIAFVDVSSDGSSLLGILRAGEGENEVAGRFIARISGRE